MRSHRRTHSRSQSLTSHFDKLAIAKPVATSTGTGVIPATNSVPTKTLYTPFEIELYTYLTNSANSEDYQAAYFELLQEVSESKVAFYSVPANFPGPNLNCGATGEEFMEWNKALLSIIGPLAKNMIRMSGEDEEAQDDQLDLIFKVMNDSDNPQYAEYLQQQGTYKYAMLVRDYNSQILNLIRENTSNALQKLFSSTKSAATAYNFIQTRFSAKIWTQAIYQMSTIPTPVAGYFEQFRFLKEGMYAARLVQPCEVPAMEFQFVMEYLRSRRDLRDHPQVADMYQRLVQAHTGQGVVLVKDVDAIMSMIEAALREISYEQGVSGSLSGGEFGVVGGGLVDGGVGVKRTRTRGRKRKSVLVMQDSNLAFLKENSNDDKNKIVIEGKENAR